MTQVETRFAQRPIPAWAFDGLRIGLRRPAAGRSLACRRPGTRLVLLCSAIVAWTASATSARGQEFDLQPPGDREFVSDQAGLLDDESVQKIRQICDRLLTDKATPIMVVTIESMAQHGGREMTIEAFAAMLFNQWQIGHAELHGQNWNTGILLLVSRGDRKARIELGAGWGHTEDAASCQIMNKSIIPQFARGDFPAGIVAGVEALDAMARKLELPGRQRSASEFLLPAVILGLGIFTVVSLIRRGASGWAWLFWGGVFTFAWIVLRSMAARSGRSRGGFGGGSFGGGSFGGGFSGGGGASGSW